MIRIARTKGGLLEDSCVWILSQKDFLEWRDGDEMRLFWIRGDPGKGETILSIAIIKELQKSIHPSSLSYFFYQGTDSRLNNATAVLKGLMYQLLVQQRSLISHFRELHDKNGRQLFENVNAFDGLSKIFTKTLDALDKCNSKLSQLLDLMQNASSSYSQVKWPVSRRKQPEIEERLMRKDRKPELSL